MRYSKARPLVSRPRVTVVVPCYRYGHYLPTMVGGVLTQEGVDVDVVVVDDASPDGSVEVARTLAAADSRVRVIAHRTNRGHIATYNHGLAEATGDLVVLLSADDLLTPGSLARSAALMEAYPEVGLVYGYPLQFSHEPPPVRPRAARWVVWSGKSWVERMTSRGRNLIFTPEVVMRRTLVEELGGYDDRLPHSADMHMWMRAAFRTDVGRIVGPDQAYYRQHDANMHTTRFGGLLDDLVERRRAFDLALEEHRSRTQDDVYVDRQLRISRRALAAEALELAIRQIDRREPDAPANAEAYVHFALQTWPASATSARMRALEGRRRPGRAVGLRRVGAEPARVLRDKVRWRVWRRWGV